MTEFAVAASALALMLLGSLAIAGYQEADRRTVLAARRAAWQESWRPGSASNEAGVESMHRELFMDTGTREPTGREPLVGQGELTVDAARRQPSGIAGGTVELLLSPLRVASGFLGSGFDLTEGGLVAGEVRAHIQPIGHMPAPFDELDLQLKVPFALLGDAWHAGGPSHVRLRASGLVPTGRLDAVNRIWQPLSVPVGILEPSLRELCLGVIEPDRIPEDRLGAGRTPQAGACQ
jgi:hypothetical protein